MDRRFLPIAALAVALVAGCPRRAKAPDPASEPEGTVMDHIAPGETPLVMPQAAAIPDAALAVDAEPIHARDVLSGAQAEQVIAESAPGAATDEPAEASADLTISPTGVGPYKLGQTRHEVLRRMGAHAKTSKLDLDPNEPSVEFVDLYGEGGGRLLRIKLYAARATEITVFTSERKAMTDADVAIGTTFEDAVLAHGPGRRVDVGRLRGWVLQDLPGVVMVPEDPDGLVGTAPPPTAKIGLIVVVGPEAD